MCSCCVWVWLLKRLGGTMMDEAYLYSGRVCVSSLRVEGLVT